MKTLFQFIVALTALLVGAFFTNGRIPGVALVLASAVAASLMAWTLQQYERKFTPLTRISRWRLRLIEPTQSPPLRLAA